MSLEVLLVDDDKMAVFLQKIIILESKFSSAVETFTSGAETLDYLINHYQRGEQFFIFLDINMPGMNGLELLEKINQQPFADKVLVAMVSSYSPAVSTTEAFNYKQVVYTFEKPITIEGCKEIMELPELKPYFPRLSNH